MVYKLYTLEHIVEISPEYFGIPKEESAYRILSQQYQGVIDADLGFIISICDIIDIGPGKIIPGSGGTFHPVKFSVLTHTSVLHEVLEGEVVELVDFGAFIRIGPTEGLCHVSQLSGEKMKYDNMANKFTDSKGRTIEVGDAVRAMIIAVGSSQGRMGKLGLTMRQPFLGKLEWIEEDLQKLSEKALKGTEGEGTDGGTEGQGEGEGEGEAGAGEEPEGETKEPKKKKSSKGKKKKSSKKK
ncbi:MAG: DNA-directed RNA polymerase [Promethearchaeota archaeon]